MEIRKKYSPKEENQLIWGDSIEVLKQVPNSSIDHCITDPPYNISGYDHKKEIGWLKSNKYWSDDKRFVKISEDWDSFSNSAYEKFTLAWIKEVLRIVKSNGNIVIFGTYHNIYRIGYVLQQLDVKIVNSITWFKPNAFPNITQRMLCESTEYAIWAVNNSVKNAKNWTFNYQRGRQLNVQKRCDSCGGRVSMTAQFCPRCGSKKFIVQNLQMRNMWILPSTSANEKKHGSHPSQKPLRLIQDLVELLSNPGDTIIDPFIGSGTLPVAAKLTGRKFVGIDLAEKYCKIAANRIRYTRQQENLAAMTPGQLF